MATASHEHITGLSASMSKNHHHVPLQDLWGLSLNQKPHKADDDDDFALEIARDLSRGPLMSSASSAPLHDTSLEDSISSIEPGPGSGVGSALSSPPTTSGRSSSRSSSVNSRNENKQGSVDPASGGGFWKQSSSNHSPPVSQGAPGSLIGLAPSSSLAQPSSSSYLAPVMGAAPLTAPLKAPLGVGATPPGMAAAPPGMSHVGVPNGPSAVVQPGSVGSIGSVGSVGSVGSIGQFSSGIWGPRQSFSGFPSAPAVYKTPWSNSTPTVASPVSAVAPASSVAAPPTATAPSSVAAPAPPSAPSSASVPANASSPTSAANGSTSVATTTAAVASGNGSPAGPSGGPTAAAPVTPVAPASAVSPSHTKNAHSHGGGAGGNHHSSHSGSHHHNNNHGNHHSGNSHHGHHHNHESRPQKKNGRPSTNTELYKTELCASFMSTGGNCPYGEKCQFAHGHQELKSVDRPPKWRSKPCQNWVKTGTCSYNERCCFRHDVPVAGSSSSSTEQMQ